MSSNPSQIDSLISMKIILSYYAILKTNSLELENNETNACAVLYLFNSIIFIKLSLILAAGIGALRITGTKKHWPNYSS